MIPIVNIYEEMQIQSKWYVNIEVTVHRPSLFMPIARHFW